MKRRTGRIFRIKKGAFCFVEYHGTNTTDVIVTTFCDGKAKQNKVLTSSLVHVSSDMQIAWILEHIQDLEDIEQGVTLKIAKVNDILPEVSQKLIDLCIHKKKRTRMSYHTLLDGITDRSSHYEIELVFQAVKLSLTDASYVKPTLEEAKDVYTFISKQYFRESLINTGDEILELLEHLYPGTELNK